MRNQLVYDLPLRFFHWLFASLFISAFLIAKTVDDESAVFSYHMLAGLLFGFTVSLRLIWGFTGTKHSRFSDFALHPKDLLAYFTGIFSRDKRKWSGHNPASSWATILMFTLALGLGVTGYLMVNGQKETFEDVHELLANGFLVVVLMHIAGVVLHALRHNDGIALSMIDGAKGGISQAETIIDSRPLSAILFMGFIAAFALYLGSNFNSQNRTLALFSTQLQLGKNEGSERNGQGRSKGAAESHEENDDD